MAARAAGWADALAQDARYAWRALRRSRTFTGSVVASLAIGIAVASASLALLLATLIGPFPAVTDQHRLVRVSASRQCAGPDCWVRMASERDYDGLRDGLTRLQSLAAYSAGQVAVGLPAAQSMRAIVVSAQYFDVLGVTATAGRLFDAVDGATSARVGVIAHRVWTREFGASPSAIGRTIRVADEFVQIVGVAPENFVGIDFRPARGDVGPDLWLPLWLADRVLPLTFVEQQRGERDLSFVGRLRSGATPADVQTEADVVASRLAVARAAGAVRTRAEVARVWRTRPENWVVGVFVVLPIPVLVLIIACVNAANLMLARGSQRGREISVRLALGARRSRIVRQLLMEAGILTLAATAIAVPVASLGSRLASTPWTLPIPFGAGVLMLTVLTAALATVAFGLVPAIRMSAASLTAALGARSDALPRQWLVRRWLLTAQVALSLGLLATAWQLVATVGAQAVSAGTPADRLLIARFDFRPLGSAATDAERFYAELVERASRLPGVEAAGLARSTAVWAFGQRAPAAVTVWTSSDRPDEGRLTAGGYAGGALFTAVGLPIVSGRGFADADRRVRPAVAIVNEAFARQRPGSILGSVLRIAARGGSAERALDVRVIGIVGDASEPRLEDDPVAASRVYLPSAIEPEPALALYVRTSGSATALAQPLRDLVAQIDPRVPVQELGSLDELNERSYTPQLWLARAAAVLGIIGLLLATGGVYGVSSYIVAMRSRDIAIRTAVGATPRLILRMIFDQSMRVAAIGLLVGSASAVVVSRIIQSEYHGIEGLDPVAFGGASLLFLSVMLVASLVPAVRAARLDPVEILKEA